MEKRIWRCSIITLAWISLTFFQSCQSSCTRPPSGVTSYRIGVITPLTGGEANYGRSTQRGIDLALEEINSRLREKNIAFTAVYEDDQMNATAGSNAIQKLTAVDKVPVIIGPFGSSVVLAVAPIAERSRTVIISASATADDIANAGDYTFRIVPPNRRQAQDVANFVWKKLGAKRASILYLNNDYGLSLRNVFEPTFKQLGGQVLTVDSFESGATDFRTQLTKIKVAGPDVVFFPDHYKESALIVKQAKELGLNTVFIGGDGAVTEDLLKLAGDSANGSYFANMAMDYESADPRVRAFLSAYRAKYQDEPDTYAAYAYDAAQIVGRAVTEGGYSAEAIKTYLYNMPPYEGLSGPTKFDKSGEVDKPFAIYVVQGRRFQQAR
jgi:branched-chain amino acid transport system substrate-binding protein